MLQKGTTRISGDQRSGPMQRDISFSQGFCCPLRFIVLSSIGQYFLFSLTKFDQWNIDQIGLF